MLKPADVTHLMSGRKIARIAFQPEEIHRRVQELGKEIGAAYPTGELLVLGLLKGSFVFVADLVREIPRPRQVDFLVASSSGAGNEWAGLSKTVAFWLLVILAPFVFIQVAMRKSADYVEVKYSNFVTALEHNNVREVVIQDLQNIRGQLKSPERVEGHDVLNFTVPLPFPASEA